MERILNGSESNVTDTVGHNDNMMDVICLDYYSHTHIHTHTI